MSDRPTAKQRERVHEIVDSILDLYHPKVKIVTKASKKIMTIEADINDCKVEKWEKSSSENGLKSLIIVTYLFRLSINWRKTNEKI